MSVFKDQIVIITGGTRGLGKAMTEMFLNAGATVIATYHSRHEEAQTFARQWEEYPLHLRCFNVAESEEVKAFYTWFNESFSRLDVLVNNSGIRRDQVCALMSEEDFSSVLDVNMTGSFLMSKGAVETMMKNRFGRIIMMSSVGSKLALKGQANYAATKAAQIAFANVLSKEVAKKGITVNSILPGFIETEMTETLETEQKKEYLKQVPMKRFGRPEEVAELVKFLASPKSSYITGAEIKIAGGL